MKEYTILASAVAILVIMLNNTTRINLLKQKKYYLFLLVIIIFKFLVNGYLTGKNIVIYNPHFFSGIRIGSIPIEDFLFGFSMVTMTIMFWEYFKKEKT